MFQAARIITQKGRLDDYIDFLSQKNEWVNVVPLNELPPTISYDTLLYENKWMIPELEICVHL